MIELILAVLSVAAAAGMRIALPLLVIGFLYGNDLWSRVPLLSQISQPLLLGVLVSWSLLEVFVAKNSLGRRVLQIIELALSPLVGTIMGLAIAQATSSDRWTIGLMGGLGGLVALVLQLVQVGWAYRLRNLPIWVVLLQDVLCVVLVLFAFGAPQQGGLIALILLWLAIRSAEAWRHWYQRQASPADQRHPRRHKQDPD
jgi:hypothetical protein